MYLYRTLLNEEKTCELVKEKEIEYSRSNSFKNPEHVCKFFSDYFELEKQTEEHVYILALNTKGNAQGVFLLSVGTVNTSLVSPRELFQKLLLVNATSFILAHNHPSGSAQISQDDIKATKRIHEAGKIIGIDLLDHIVIGDNVFESAKEKGIF